VTIDKDIPIYNVQTMEHYRSQESEQQRLDASIAARSTPGIRAIVDDLRIDTAARE